MKRLNKNAIKRGQSLTCLNYAECKHFGRCQTNSMSTLLITVATMIGITIYASCSADEDFWGFDEGYTSTENTRAEMKDMSEYLSLSTYDYKKWTDEDYTVIGKAIERMNFTFHKDRYVSQVSCAKNVNISDSLYKTIQNMYEHTNMLIRTGSNGKIVRNKRTVGETSGFVCDCVPQAVAHMGAPHYTTLDQVLAKCTELFPNWQSQGGILEPYVIQLIYEFHPVKPYKNMSFCKKNKATDLDSLVLLFHWSETTGHAVNAYKYDPTTSNKLIYYVDHSSTSLGPGTIHAANMFKIFVFE